MDKSTFKKVTITLPEDLFKKYQKYCEAEGMNLSSRIAILLKKDLEK
ncbi:MAG: hypothetical protein QT11_C0001G0462 [archaeon GW2011_AR20]|nr:MAG: hypothetical protein QT11_C0001G0462 [archaeon GW2011_AR20]AQS28133.1 hypothetical protein [uncultured archaeon]AQS28733.1 hypothetical protein [uncultured archaeon]MBS3160570.1 hypothetical protein [Candidatus Woesearchaeota archaeon]